MNGDTRWNNLPWDSNANPVLVFRQISPQPDFAGSFERPDIAVSEDDGTIDLNEIKDRAASGTIGEYAPSGKYCTIEEFRQSRCGL